MADFRRIEVWSATDAARAVTVTFGAVLTEQLLAREDGITLIFVRIQPGASFGLVDLAKELMRLGQSDAESDSRAVNGWTHEDLANLVGTTREVSR